MRIPSRRAALALASLLSLGLLSIGTAPSAMAQGEAELESSIVFFEFYLRNEPSSKTQEYVAGVQKEIAMHKKYSILARKDAYDRVRTTMVPPMKRINDDRLIAIGKMMAEGDKLIYTNPKQAIEVLRQAKVELKEIVENISLDSKIRKDYFTTQMLLVRSHIDNQSPEKAREIMVEVVRTFEDEYPVTEDNYHPNVVDLYKEVFRSLKDNRTASLTISTNPAGCDVFVNGRPMKEKTPFTYQSLYPGTIRVQVRHGALQSMVRTVEVGEKATGKLDVDLEYEAAMTFSDDAFGLTFTDAESMKRNMLNYSVKLGALLDVDYVILTGVQSMKDGPALVGYQVGVKDKKLVRQKDYSVKANVVSNNRIRELAAFLADVNLGDKGKVYKPWFKNILGWSLAGAGLVSIGVGAGFYVKYLQARDNAQDTAQDYDFRLRQAENGTDAQTLGGIFVGVGAALCVGAALVFPLYQIEDEEAYLGDTDYALDRRPTFFAVPVALPGGGGFSAEWRF